MIRSLRISRISRLAALALAAALPSPARAEAVRYEIDAVHSSVGFSVRHLMVSTVRGSFGKFSGSVTWDDKDAARSLVEATIDATSITTGQEQRDGHLKSADFFDVEKHPAITFKSKKVEKAGEGRLKVTGDFTMRGVTKEIVLEVEGPAPPMKSPMGSITGASATARINRQDFGVSWSKKLDSGGVAVGDEVAIQIDLELKAPAPPAAAPATAGTGTKAK